MVRTEPAEAEFIKDSLPVSESWGAKFGDSASYFRLNTSGAIIKSQESGRGLDASDSMETQVIVTTKITFYHLRLIKQLTPTWTSMDLATTIHTMVTSGLDYCNSST